MGQTPPLGDGSHKYILLSSSSRLRKNVVKLCYGLSEEGLIKQAAVVYTKLWPA